MTNKKISLFYVIFCLLAISYWYIPFLKVGYTTVDDMEWGLKTFHTSNLLTHITNYVNFSGRISHFSFGLLGSVPHLFGFGLSFQIIKLLGLVLLLTAFFFFFFQVTKNILFSVFIISMSLFLMTVNWHHHPLTSYPFIININYAFLLLSITLFLRGLENKSHKNYILSNIFFLIAIATYEAFIPYIFIFIIISLFTKNSSKNLKLIFFPIMSLTIWCSFYFYFKMNSSNSYGGTHFNLDLKNIWQTFFKYLWGSLPGAYFLEEKIDFGSINIKNLFSLISLVMSKLDVFFVILLAGTISPLIFLSEKIETKINSTKLIIIGFLMTTCPLIVISLSSKYHQWTLHSGYHYYATSYFAYFGWIILGSFLYLSFINMILKYNNKKYYYFTKTLLLSIFFVLALITNYSNQDTILQMKKSHTKWLSIDSLSNEKLFERIKDNSILFMPNYKKNYGIASASKDYWVRLFNIFYNKNNLKIAYNEKELISLYNSNQERDIYSVDYLLDDKTAKYYSYIGKIDNSSLSNNKVLLNDIYFSDLVGKQFNYIELKTKNIIKKTFFKSLLHLEVRNLSIKCFGKSSYKIDPYSINFYNIINTNKLYTESNFDKNPLNCIWSHGLFKLKGKDPIYYRENSNICKLTSPQQMTSFMINLYGFNIWKFDEINNENSLLVTHKKIKECRKSIATRTLSLSSN